MLFTDILLTVLSYAIVPVILYIAYVKFRGPEHEKSLQIPAANRKRVTIRTGVIAALLTSPLILLYLASWEMAIEKLQALGRLLMLFLLLPLGVVIALVFAIVLNVLAAKERQK